MPKKVVHAVNYAESERHTCEWRVWTYCWKNFRAESSWVVSLTDFKFLLGREDRQALCRDCPDKVLRPPEATPKVEPRKGPFDRPRRRTYVTWSGLWTNWVRL